MNTAQKFIFKPTGEHFLTQKGLNEAANRFYSGELNEEFALYYANHSLHAFWLNYKERKKKVNKQEFMIKFKALINHMLSDI